MTYRVEREILLLSDAEEDEDRVAQGMRLLSGAKLRDGCGRLGRGLLDVARAGIVVGAVGGRRRHDDGAAVDYHVGCNAECWDGRMGGSKKHKTIYTLLLQPTPCFEWASGAHTTVALCVSRQFCYATVRGRSRL